MPDMDVATSIQRLSAAIIPVVFGITVHEVAHGLMARRCGDRTAELQGRLTLNPLKHIDPVGSVVVPLVFTLLSLPPFGWAKPLPVNTRNLRRPKRDMVLVAMAGPASNLAMAIFWTLVFAAALHSAGPVFGTRQFLLSMAEFGIKTNVLLAIFNLLPIPPLDGGRVLRGLVPEGLGRTLDRVEPYGLILVLGLLLLRVLDLVLVPALNFVSRWFFAAAGA